MSSAPPFDAARFKAQERAGFNRIAARYAAGAHLRDTLADALLASAAIQPGQRILDLASGPALLARRAALAAGPRGLVVASDIAEQMLAQALHGETHPIAAGASAPIVGVATDAEHMAFADGDFDLVLAGLALFMFPTPAQALSEARRVLRRDGRLCLSVWGECDDVPLIACAQRCIARVLPPPKVARPSVFRFGAPDTLRATLTAAGFDAVQVEPCRFSCHFADADAYWQAFLDLAGGATEALARLPASQQTQLRDEVAADLAAFATDDGFALPATAWVASARKPD